MKQRNFERRRRIYAQRLYWLADDFAHMRHTIDNYTRTELLAKLRAEREELEELIDDILN